VEALETDKAVFRTANMPTLEGPFMESGTEAPMNYVDPQAMHPFPFPSFPFTEAGGSWLGSMNALDVGMLAAEPMDIDEADLTFMPLPPTYSDISGHTFQPPVDSFDPALVLNTSPREPVVVQQLGTFKFASHQLFLYSGLTILVRQRPCPNYDGQLK
jgi:hypothetical protein